MGTYTPDTRSGKALYAYIEQMIRYLNAPSAEGRALLKQKMQEWSECSGILLHYEKLEKQLYWLEKDHPDYWESFAEEAERRWFFDSYPDLKEMFFQTAAKRKLAKMKWVIC